MRMQRRQLAMALDTFGARTAAAKARRERMDRLVRRMMHAEMARAFDGLREGVEQERGRREMVARAIGRWSRPAAFGMFEMWKQFVITERDSQYADNLEARLNSLQVDMSRSQEQLSTSSFHRDQVESRLKAMIHTVHSRREEILHKVQQDRDASKVPGTESSEDSDRSVQYQDPRTFSLTTSFQQNADEELGRMNEFVKNAHVLEDKFVRAARQIDGTVLELQDTLECRNAELSVALILSEDRL